MHQRYELVQKLNARLEGIAMDLDLTTNVDPIDTVKDRLGASVVRMVRDHMNQETLKKMEEKMRPVKSTMSKSLDEAGPAHRFGLKRSSEPIISSLSGKPPISRKLNIVMGNREFGMKKSVDELLYDSDDNKEGQEDAEDNDSPIPDVPTPRKQED
ncbi:hypothetical protein L596_005755 [Steinernema carpocapsae]|nr:hypothetical protein L596_005755 [Steinernema carpocapsae]